MIPKDSTPESQLATVIDQPDIFIQLKSPSAYRHTVDGPVVLHETHISWVFLAGHFAYKIKKRLQIDFVDYGTLAKRYHACCEEIRLNSRYSEGLYCDVVPITIEDGALIVDGDSQPIEFAVRMRRFPEDALLAKRLESRRVEESEVVELARSVASFHRRADVDRGSIEPKVESILRQAILNMDMLYSMFPNELQGAVQELKDWTCKFFSIERDSFRKRIVDGYIRECHGDLHTENIVYWHDKLVPFDGIEFNTELSWIDVLNDVAFLVMDLESRDRDEFAACFLNAYLEETGDYESLQLLTWYKVYRALVRAKVTMIRHQQATDAKEKSKWLQKAEEYLRLAGQAKDDKPRQIWITHGVSGSGKTTASLVHVRFNRAIRIRSDIERKRLFAASMNLQPTVRLGEGIYSSSANEATYSKLLHLTRRILQAGFSVVVDAAFLRRSDREAFRTMAEEEKSRFQILHCQAEVPELRRRIVDRDQRRTDASDATLRVLDRQLIDQEPLTPSELSITVNAVSYLETSNTHQSRKESVT